MTSLFSRRLEESITIKASRSQVWKVLTDLDAFPSWNTFVVSASTPADTPLALDAPTIITIIVKPGNKPSTYHNVITKFEPERELVWQGGFGYGIVLGVRVEHFQILQDGREPDTCEYCQGEIFTGAMVPLLGLTSTFDDLKAAYARMNRDLKLVVEGAC